MSDVVLCTDIGTTSLKAALITAEGEVVSVSSYKFVSPDNRFIASRWFLGFKNAFEKLCRGFCGEVKIKALSISGNGPTVVLQNGLTSLWNEYPQIAKERTKTSLFLPNVLFIKDNFEKDFEQSNFVFSGPEYLIYKLTGNAITILPEQRFIPAYWDDSMLTEQGIAPSKMPPFKTVGECFGVVTDECMKELGLEKFADENLPVYGAGPDFVAALIGTGTLKEGRICDRSGSSEGINFCVPKFVQKEGVRTLPSVISGLWNVSVLIPKSSRIQEDKRLLLIKDAVESLKELAAQNGFEFPQKLTVTGGQTRNASYMKKKAKTLGLKLSVCRCSDSELLGDACAAWYGLGKYKSLEEAGANIVREGRVYEGI